MASEKNKKGKESKKPEKVEVSEQDAERQAQLHQERRENEVLENETNHIHKESEDYILYMSRLTQKRQNAILALRNQRQQKLEEFSKQREAMQEKHDEQLNGLKKEIWKMETELSMLNPEIAQIGDVKSLRQQQLESIAELEQEMIATCHRHFETLQILKAKGLTENEQYKPPKHMMFELYLKAKKEASFYILSYIREISWENHHLHDELQHLVERAQSLHRHQQILQTHRRDLLLEREVQELQHIHTSIAGADAN
ncbi:uncharacterized protein ccdc166 isoform X2 [Silurus meridionalis]|uniref:uncharacterized protein ccdc166 isoform X2 n=1 Tax=Silurus meridionalis TaxID=175797 RepID=UPI001EEA25EB|nr:uncharacterized protein ccdc166 isoform X2 [Silurus meridionalis]